MANPCHVGWARVGHTEDERERVSTQDGGKPPDANREALLANAARILESSGGRSAEPSSMRQGSNPCPQLEHQLLGKLAADLNKSFLILSGTDLDVVCASFRANSRDHLPVDDQKLSKT